MVIRINALPEQASPAASAFLALDGAATEKATIANIVAAGAPLASEAEARAGADNAKRMTPLRVKQSIDEEVGVSLASASQGSLADTALQPADIPSIVASVPYELDSVTSAVADYHPFVAPTKILVSGYALPGDGGKALYVEAVSEPSHEGKFQLTLAEGDTVWYELAEHRPNCRMFGTMGDGTTDDSAVTQKMIDFIAAKGGGTGYAPAGNYYPATTILPKDNVTVICDDDADWITTNLASPASANGMVRFSGARSAGVTLAANVTRDSRTITTVLPHGLAVGDLVYIFGQRSALGTDATAEWRLGTGNSGPAYYAEFGVVAVVNSATSFDLSKGLVFPDYKTTGHGETDPNARPATTIHKVTPVKNARWIGGKINSMRLNNNFFRGDWAWNCSVEDVEIDGKQFKGGMTLWRNCYECDSIKVRSRTDPATVMTDLEHDDWNHHKIASSHDCNLIDCESSHSSQCWDISYFTGEGVNLYCGVYGFKSRGARYNAGTTHPGAFATDVEDGKYLDNSESGISIRSRGGKIHNNRLTGNSRLVSGEVGISIYDGWARDNLVTDNYVDGFNTGIQVWDSDSTDGQFTYIGCKISDNTVIRCGYGIRRTSVGSNINNVESGLVITDNDISWIGSKHIEIDNYTRGVVITGNSCFGPLTSGSTAQYIHLLANCVNAVIIGNHLYNGAVGDVGIDIDSVTDNTTFPAPLVQWASEVNPNYFHKWAGTEFAISSTYIKVPDIWRVGRPGVLPLADGVTAPAAIAGFAQFFVDTADGDLKVKFGDGVTKTISVDT